MKKLKNCKTLSQVYEAIGLSLCTCAGAIVGLVAGGPLFVTPGLFVGLVSGSLLSKGIVDHDLA